MLLFISFIKKSLFYFLNMDNSVYKLGKKILPKNIQTDLLRRARNGNIEARKSKTNKSCSEKIKDNYDLRRFAKESHLF